jgi:hypothetical protein
VVDPVSSNRESSRLASGVTCALVGSSPANARIASIDSKRVICRDLHLVFQLLAQDVSVDEAVDVA